MTAHIGEYSYRDADDGRVPRAHAIHPVVKVRAVRHSRDDKYRHDDKEYPPRRGLVFSAETHDVRVVQIMSLHKRYGGLERLAGFSAVFHHYLAALFLDGEILVHLHVRRHPEHQSDNQSDAHLPHNLVLPCCGGIS